LSLSPKGEREHLIDLLSKGKHSAQLYRTAYILLNCDEGQYGDKLINEQVSKVLLISVRMKNRVKQKFVKEGFECCFEPKPLSKTREKSIDGDA
jgi:hypothetical protein